jgi:ribosome maturation factor RimP
VQIPSFSIHMISKEQVRNLAQERINDLDRGLFIVEISISAKNAIHVELDKVEGYVAIEDCVSVSRNIEHNLDREEQDFELHVSSAGLDKPLRVLPQFVKNLGRELESTLKNGQTKKGILKHVDEKGIILQTSRMEKLEGKKKKELIEEEENLPFENIKETKIVISFK